MRDSESLVPSVWQCSRVLQLVTIPSIILPRVGSGFGMPARLWHDSRQDSIWIRSHECSLQLSRTGGFGWF